MVNLVNLVPQGMVESEASIASGAAGFLMSNGVQGAPPDPTSIDDKNL